MIKRAAAVIIKDGEVLLMRRVKAGEEYYTFPGGTVEPGESPEAAAVRELEEEFCIQIDIDRFLFEAYADNRRSYHFLVNHFTGTPTLGGEELRHMTGHNQYHPAWVPLADIPEMMNFHPEEARQKFESILSSLHGPAIWNHS